MSRGGPRIRKYYKFDREGKNFKMHENDDSEDTEDFSQDHPVTKEMKCLTKLRKRLDRQFDDIVFGTFLVVIVESFMQMMVAGVLFWYIPPELNA
jgi:hypothetical protein